MTINEFKYLVLQELKKQSFYEIMIIYLLYTVVLFLGIENIKSCKRRITTRGWRISASILNMQNGHQSQ